MRKTRNFLMSWLLLGATIAPDVVLAQKFEDLRKPAKPLVLESVGSFFVGGRNSSQSATQVGVPGGEGGVVVEQMYVQYMIPKRRSEPPIVMIHGGVLSGKSYETTPDGRMGWYEYFARRGYPSFVVDQIGRARSGFDQAMFNDVRTGKESAGSLPPLRRASDDVAWVRFRFGPKQGTAFPDGQFPVAAADQFGKQGVPEIGDGAVIGALNAHAISELGAKLHGAVIVGHSQSGRFPFEAGLLNPSSVAAAVSIEPSGCNAAHYDDAQIRMLSRIPILVMFGDYLDAPQKIGTSPINYLSDCKVFVDRIAAVGGRATLLHLPDIGIRGNSHMIMEDRNSLDIANVIIRWLHGKPVQRH